MLAADSDALAAAAGRDAAARIRAAGEAMRHVLLAELEARPLVASGTALIDYLAATGSWGQVEQVRALFLDARHRLIRDDLMASGCITEAPIHVRQLVKRGLDLGAAALILVHNHPSGDPTPSPADRDLTRQLAQAARSVGLSLLDHVIVARGRWASCRELGIV